MGSRLLEDDEGEGFFLGLGFATGCVFFLFLVFGRLGFFAFATFAGLVVEARDCFLATLDFFDSLVAGLLTAGWAVDEALERVIGGILFALVSLLRELTETAG